MEFSVDSKERARPEYELYSKPRSGRGRDTGSSDMLVGVIGVAGGGVHSTDGEREGVELEEVDDVEGEGGEFID